MNKTYRFILFTVAALCFAACSDDEPEAGGIEGRDRFISDFALTASGITYQAAIAGDKITVEIPYNASLEGATVDYILSEGAAINPDPSAIQDWENEWKFVVTSKTQESKVYLYTYRYADIEQSGSVVLATQAEADAFAETGINKIDGNLTIGTADGEEITSLAGLANLQQISNALVIHPSYKGADLSGLDRLERIGSFKLGSATSASKNTTLKTVNLPSLRDVAGDFVINCSAVEKVSIPEVEAIGEDLYVASDALLDLDANAVSAVGASLIVKGSVAEKAAAETEAIVFASLQRVGNELAVQYFPKLQGIYLPELKNVTNAVSFTDLSLIGSIAITELQAIGDLTISNCSNLSTVELPNLVSTGAFNIQGGQLNKLNISSLKNIRGDMTFRAVTLRELDLSRIEFNGNTLSISASSSLSKLAGPETFNGNLNLTNRVGDKTKEFVIEGFSNLNGSFNSTQIYALDELVIPFVSVTGDVTAKTIYSSYGVQKIKFPYLQEVGGILTLAQLNNVTSVEFPALKTIGGACSVSTGQQKGDTIFPELENIGSEDSDATTEFSIFAADIVCPKLKTISGNWKITAGNATPSKSLSYPNLETVSNNLEMTSTSANKLISAIDFPSLKNVKRIGIKNWNMVKDFTTFGYLFENGILTEESQWTVTSCGYNPTYQDMKEGRYKSAE